MLLSAKAEYALRALLELSLHQQQAGEAPLKIALIAERQKMPQKFLEVILGQLRGGGFVTSRRGADGGYLLARLPAEVSVLDVVRYIDGLPEEAAIATQGDAASDAALSTMANALHAEVVAVLSETTIASLADHAREALLQDVPNWTI